MRDGNRKGIMIIVIKQSLVFWDLFSLESLQFNKWIWHHHWAGNKLAHFPLVYLLRPRQAPLCSLKEAFTNYLRSPTFCLALKVLSVFLACLVLSLLPFWLHSFAIPRSTYSSRSISREVFGQSSLVPTTSQALGDKAELCRCSENSGGGNKELSATQASACNSRHLHEVFASSNLLLEFGGDINR